MRLDRGMQIFNGSWGTQAPSQVFRRSAPLSGWCPGVVGTNQLVVNTILVPCCCVTYGFQIPAILPIVTGDHLAKGSFGLGIRHITQRKGHFTTDGGVFVAGHLFRHRDKFPWLCETQRSIGYQAVLGVLRVEQVADVALTF